MPDAVTATFGISRVTGALIQSVETTDKIEKKVLKGSDGNDALVRTYNPTTTGSVKGHGDLTIVPGIGDAGVTGVVGAGGITVIDEVKKTEGNEEFAGWDYTFSYYPTAVSANA